MKLGLTLLKDKIFPADAEIVVRRYTEILLTLNLVKYGGLNTKTLLSVILTGLTELSCPPGKTLACKLVNTIHTGSTIKTLVVVEALVNI